MIAANYLRGGRAVAVVPAQPGQMAVVAWSYTDDEGNPAAGHHAVPLVGFRVILAADDPFARPWVDLVVPGEITSSDGVALLLPDGTAVDEDGVNYPTAQAFADDVLRRHMRRLDAEKKGAA